MRWGVLWAAKRRRRPRRCRITCPCTTPFSRTPPPRRRPSCRSCSWRCGPCRPQGAPARPLWGIGRLSQYDGRPCSHPRIWRSGRRHGPGGTRRHMAVLHSEIEGRPDTPVFGERVSAVGHEELYRRHMAARRIPMEGRPAILVSGVQVGAHPSPPKGRSQPCNGGPSRLPFPSGRRGTPHQQGVEGPLPRPHSSAPRQRRAISGHSGTFEHDEEVSFSFFSTNRVQVLKYQNMQRIGSNFSDRTLGRDER